jgi:hypothetical protein
VKLALKQASIPKGSSKKTVWEVRERLQPLPLPSLEGNEFLVQRILFDKVSRKFYLDIRTFEKVVIEKDGKPAETLRITDKGTCYDLDTWISCLPQAASLIRKYRK